MDIEFIKELSNLGGMFLALCASAYFVKYTSDSHKNERSLLYQKDTENDQRLASLFEKTHAEYMASMQQLNMTLSTMSTAITELRSEIKIQNERQRRD
tara:strand:- start:284 stop:577 length:294 start_codon:yes stop_codon:yes gene_type:complete